MSTPDEIFFELGIGTRMRRLQELMTADAERFYEELGIKFRVSYFYAVYALSQKGSMPIAEIARLAGFSHSAVSQTVKRLAGEGLVRTSAMPDGRQKCVDLTEEGLRVVSRLRPVWDDIETVIKDAMTEGGANILDGINALEKSFQRKSLYDRVKAKQESRTFSPPSFDIQPYDIRHSQAFYALNRRWLEAYFKVEPIDETVLSDPETHILSKGGEIYLAVIEGRAVGAVAMKVQEPGVFELTKLAVDPDVQQGGMGRALCEKVIERFQARGGNTLYLETNTKLVPAIKLYEKLNFKAMAPPEPSPYERANYYMKWMGEANDPACAE